MYNFGFNNIFIAFSYECNSYCKKCITRFHKNLKKSMSPDTFCALVTFLRTHNFQGLINVGSGEPLIFPNLEQYIQQLLALNDKIKIRILTNGIALKGIPASLLYNKRIIWGITLDGFYQKDLNGLQENVLIEEVKKDIIYLKDKDVNLYLNYTLNSQNENSLSSFLDYCLENNIKETYITELQIWDGFEKTLTKYLPNRIHACNILEEYEVKFNQKGLFFRHSFKTKNSFTQCYMSGKNNPIIDVDGSITFCEGREDGIIANIHDKDCYKKIVDFGNYLQSKPNNWCHLCSSALTNKGTHYMSRKIFPKRLDEINKNGN